jgi:Fe-Mn family superoxide dismutase
VQNTLNYHWGKHHRAYVDNMNKQIAGSDLEKKSLEEVRWSLFLPFWLFWTSSPLFVHFLFHGFTIGTLHERHQVVMTSM